MNWKKTIPIIIIGAGLLGVMIYFIAIRLKLIIAIVSTIYSLAAIIPFLLTFFIAVNIWQSGTILNFLGTFTFLISDAMIGIRKAYTTNSAINSGLYEVGVVGFYHVGLLLIAYGLIKRFEFHETLASLQIRNESDSLV